MILTYFQSGLLLVGLILVILQRQEIKALKKTAHQLEKTIQNFPPIEEWEEPNPIQQLDPNYIPTLEDYLRYNLPADKELDLVRSICLQEQKRGNRLQLELDAANAKLQLLQRK